MDHHAACMHQHCAGFITASLLRIIVFHSETVYIALTHTHYRCIVFVYTARESETAC